MCMDRNARCSRTGIEGTRLCHLSELNLLVGRPLEISDIQDAFNSFRILSQL